MSSPLGEDHAPSGSLLLGCVLFLLALLIRLLFYFFNQDLTFYQVSVSGVPFSDAKGWNDLAVSIADGRGMVGVWSGQRPLYPFLLACLYTWFGPSFEIGKILNVLASALFVPFVYLIIDKIFNRMIGVFVALFLILERSQLAFSLTIMCEPTGTLFFVVGFYLLLRALEHRKKLAFFMSGSFLALSNLSRPLTLFCVLPFSAFIYWFLQKRSTGSRAIAHGLLLFALGLFLVLTPWILRQKAVHGILTISDKTADTFYAATSPELGIWTQEVDAEMLRLGITGIRERNRYLMGKGFENLKEHPFFFLMNISSTFFSYVRGFYYQEWAFTFITPLFIACLFLLVPLRQRGVGKKAIMALLGGCAIAFQVLSGPISHVITLAGMALSLIRRKNDYPILLASVFIFSGVFLSIGGSPNLISRSLLIVGWVFDAYHLYFYTCFFYFVYQLVFRDETVPSLDSTIPFLSCHEEESGLAAKVTGRLIKGFAFCTALFFLVTGARIAYLNFLAEHPETAYPKLSDVEQRKILRGVVGRFPNAFSQGELNGQSMVIGNVDPLLLDTKAHRKLLVAAGRVTPYVYRVPGFLDLDHMSRVFFPRAYDRTIILVEDVGFCVMPDPLPEGFAGKDVIVVGRLDFRTDIIYEGRALVEVIALLPWDPRERVSGPTLIASNEVHEVRLRLLRPTH